MRYRLNITKDEELNFMFVNGAKKILEDEIDMLEHISTPEAKESVHIAKERVAYLAIQLDNSS